MRVMITGAGGMLAREIVKQWTNPRAEAGHAIVPLRHTDLDITNMTAVRRTVEAVTPDIIVNCAAYNKVDDAETQVEAAYRVNTLGPRNLAIAAEEHRISLVHFSTDYVFDGTSTRPYCEYDSMNPINVYGRSKAAGELAVRDQTSRFYIARLAWLVGYGGRNFVETMLRIGSEKGKVAVVTDQIGCPTFCFDVARNLAPLITSGEFGIYHMTGNGQCSWHEFAVEIFRRANMPEVDIEETTLATLGRPAPRPKYTVLRNLMLELGVGDLMPPWQESLSEYLKGRETA
jgi:dTDP-4-dehydrorhamnose reductase